MTNRPSTDILIQVATISESIQSESINLYKLIVCATSALACQLVSVSLVFNGGDSLVLKLVASNGSNFAANISNKTREKFQPRAKRSEMATMAFVRNSGLYPELRVPKIYDFDTTFTNPVGAPYVLMEFLEGRQLHTEIDPSGLTGFQALNDQNQQKVIQAMANLQAVLSRTVPFEKIGSLFEDGNGHFIVAGMEHGINHTGADRAGRPFSSLSDMWYTFIEREICSASCNWSLNFDIYPPNEFSRLATTLTSLVPHFLPPAPYLTLVLHHPDIAIRNLLFDPGDFSKIVGVLDWDRSQVLPLILASRYPDDLISRNFFPYFRPGYPRGEGWENVPHNWTHVGNAKLLSLNEDFEEVAPFAEAQVKLFYQRQLFSTKYARAIFETNKDSDISRASIFADSEFYLMFHETLMGGVGSWFQHKEWIEETYKRVKGKVMRENELIKGPNAFSYSTLEKANDIGTMDVPWNELLDRVSSLQNRDAS